MIELDGSVPSELAPLSWLIGLWEGTGVVHYAIGDEVREVSFGQRLTFTHDGLPYLNYASYTWLLDDEKTPHVSETGYWRLSRPLVEADPGPGMLPPAEQRPFTTADEVETLRNATNGFDVEVALVHPGGVMELYIGQVAGARIDLSTDAVIRSHGAKEYTAATRIYGLVDSHLLWAWDIAALGQSLRTHASARLAKTD